MSETPRAGKPRRTTKKKAKTGAKRPAGRRSRGDTDEAKQFAIEAARSLAGDKCDQVVALDVRGRSQVSDYLVIGSGTSERQMRSAADHVAVEAERRGRSLYRSNKDEPRQTWIVLDFVDVVVHVFEPTARAYYDLEMLWGDAERLTWRPRTAARRPAASDNGEKGARRKKRPSRES